MAFGQQSGPPASSSQLRTLLELLREAGHDDFRDARATMGFTQRQAGGRFTRDEAATFIDTLEERGADPDGSATGSADDLGPEERALRALSSTRLAAELRRRGWRVSEPTR